jgi:phosphate-selective porin OprO/OprP
MLAKFAVSALIVAGTLYTAILSSTAQAQQSTYLTTAPRVAAVSLQDDDSEAATNEKLQEQLRRLQVRLEELENDVEQKLDSQPQAREQAASSNEAVGERLEQLEESFEKQTKAVGKLEDAVPGFVVHGHKSPKLKFFGRIHSDYWAFPKADASLQPLEGGDPQDRFNFRRLRIGISGDLNDNMFYKYEGEFAGGSGNTSYRDAYIGFKDLPRLNTVIIGNHKRPYGLDHLNSSRHNVFIERPFIVEALNQDSRRLGISSNGVSEDESWNWRYGVWNQQLTQTSSGYVGDHYQLEVAGRLARTAWYDESSGGRGYAHFALSGSAGTPDGSAGSTNNQARYRTRPEARSDGRWLDTGAISGANANYLIGLESVINIGAFNLTSEYMRSNVDRRDAVGEDVAFEGYYTQVSYFLTGEHRRWNRSMGTLDRILPFENFFIVRDCDCNTQKGWGAWEVAARYSYADFNDFDILGGEGQSLTLGVNWYWNPYARMQFNYINGDIKSGPAAAGQGNYEIMGVRLMVDF